jgi:LacI family transcriptional regulator
VERVTKATVAARAGVSKNTVSLAFRHDPSIPEATQTRVEKVARALGYSKNPIVAQLMTELRRGTPASYRRTFALLNAFRDREALTQHWTIPSYVEGLRRRGNALGYRFDDFWLHDPELNGTRLDRILRARGIRGAIVVGLFFENELPHRFDNIWRDYACVVTGVRTDNPTLSFCCVDHHELVLEAVRRALELGYQRPSGATAT